MISRVILMGLIFISMDSWYFACTWVMEFIYIWRDRVTYYKCQGNISWWEWLIIQTFIISSTCLTLPVYTNVLMVSLSESFRRLCYIGSYPRQTETIGWGPQKKSGVDCTNEWYLGGVFVYILAAILSCVCRNCIKLVPIIESIWSGSIDIRIMVTYLAITL